MFHIIRLPISIIFLKYFKLNFIQIKNKTQKYNLTVLLNPQDFVALRGIKAQQLKRSQMQVRKHFFTFFFIYLNTFPCKANVNMQICICPFVLRRHYCCCYCLCCSCFALLFLVSSEPWESVPIHKSTRTNYTQV